MMQVRIAVALGSTLFVLGLFARAPALAQDKNDTQIAVLTGEWKITFTNDAVRVYIIEKSGKMSGTADEAKLKGQITRKDGMLLLTFDGSDDLERLTLGTDGRLFIERFDQKSDFPQKKPTHIGIGTREK